MFYKLHRFGLYLGVGLILVLGFGYLVEAFDPYAISTWGMRQAVRENPELAQNAQFYSQTAESIQGAAVGLDITLAPIRIAVENPSSHAILDALADKFAPGSSEILDSIMDFTEKVKLFNEAIYYLAISPDVSSLHTKIAAKEPLTNDELYLVYASSANMHKGLSILEPQSKQLYEFISLVTTDSSYQSLKMQLEKDVGGQKGLKTNFYNGMVAWEETAVNLYRINQRIEKDRATFEKITFWFLWGQAIDDTLQQLYITPAAEIVVKQTPFLLTLLTLSLGFTAAGWLGSGLLHDQNIPVPVFQQSVRLVYPTIPKVRLHKKPDTSELRFPTMIECVWENGRFATFPLPQTSHLTIGGTPRDDIQIELNNSPLLVAKIRKARTRHFIELMNTTVSIQSSSAGIIKNDFVPKQGEQLKIKNVTITFL